MNAFCFFPLRCEHAYTYYYHDGPYRDVKQKVDTKVHIARFRKLRFDHKREPQRLSRVCVTIRSGYARLITDPEKPFREATGKDICSLGSTVNQTSDRHGRLA